MIILIELQTNTTLLSLGRVFVLFKEKSLRSLTKWHHSRFMWFRLAWVWEFVCLWVSMCGCLIPLGSLFETAGCLWVFGGGFSEFYQPWQASDKVLLTTAFCACLLHSGAELMKTCKSETGRRNFNETGVRSRTHVSVNLPLAFKDPCLGMRKRRRVWDFNYNRVYVKTQQHDHEASF